MAESPHDEQDFSPRMRAKESELLERVRASIANNDKYQEAMGIKVLVDFYATHRRLAEARRWLRECINAANVASRFRSLPNDVDPKYLQGRLAKLHAESVSAWMGDIFDVVKLGSTRSKGADYEVVGRDGIYAELDARMRGEFDAQRRTAVEDIKASGIKEALGSRNADIAVDYARLADASDHIAELARLYIERDAPDDRRKAIRLLRSSQRHAGYALRYAEDSDDFRLVDRLRDRGDNTDRFINRMILKDPGMGERPAARKLKN